MTTLLGLLPFVFGAVAIVVYAHAKRPVLRHTRTGAQP